MFGKVRQPPTEEQIREALKQVKFPGFSRDIISFGIVKSVTIAGNGDVTVPLHISTRDENIRAQIERELTGELKQFDKIHIEMTAQQPPQSGQMPMAGQTAAPTRPGIPGVKTIVAVA